MKLSKREKVLIKIKSLVGIILTALQKLVREREQGYNNYNHNYYGLDRR